MSFSMDTLDERVGIVSSYLKPGAKLITNDPTLPPEEKVSTPAYVLMQTIDGYPQPLPTDVIERVFLKHGLRPETIGNNWVIAEKVGDS